MNFSKNFHFSFFFCIAIIFSAGILSAGTIEWESIDAGNGEALYSDSSLSTKLPEGCLVQLILDVNGDGLKPIEYTSSTSPRGDDILMPITTGDGTGSIGANLPFDKDGHFQYTDAFDEVTYAGKTVYVRFWNSSSPGVGSKYGESEGLGLSNTSLPQIFNIVANGSLYTDKTLSGPDTTLTVNVYDSATNITIYAPLIKLYNSDGRLLDSKTTNPCVFEVEKRGSYYLRVEKQGYIFPSKNKSAAAYGDHGDIFEMGYTSKELNVPVDRGDVLTIQYTVSKKQAVVGEGVAFNISIQNNSTLAQENVSVEATRMNALKYVSNSASLDGQKINITESGGKYNFTVSSISGSGTASLIYRTIVSTGASKGKYNSIALSYNASGVQISNADEVSVLVGEDTLMEKGTIIGKVFYDTNADWMQGKDEKGIEGVKIVTEYGVIVTTDRDGKYHIPDVSAGRHILKVMEKTLPDTDAVILENPKWIETTEGILNKVNFSVIKKEKPAPRAEEKKLEEKKPAEKEKIEEKGFKKKEEEKKIEGKKEKIIEKKVVEESPEGKYIREERYELVEKVIEEVMPDGRVVKKKVRGYVKTEFVGEVEIIETEEAVPEIQPPPEVEISKPKEEIKPEIVRELPPVKVVPPPELPPEKVIPPPVQVVPPTELVPEKVVPPPELPPEKVLLPPELPPELPAEKVLLPPELPPEKVLPPPELPPEEVIPPSELAPEKVIPPPELPPEEVIPPSELAPEKVVPPPELAPEEVIPLPELVPEEVVPPPELVPEKVILPVKPVVPKIFKIFKDTFIVAYAEGTLRKNEISGKESMVTDKDKFMREGWRGDGRLAFTILGKLFNKIDFISSLDTDRIKSAAEMMLAKQKLITNLYDDNFYPTYGDASQIDYSATDTQDILYAKAKLDESEAMWGSYRTEIPMYQKTFHGGKVKIRSAGKTRFDETKTEIDAFAAKDHQTAAHDEFVATGGSLYYLKNREIIEGSEQLQILVKDRITGRVLKNIPLKDEYDYTIDYATGRILLTKPLSSVSYFDYDTAVSNDLLAGNQVVMTTDYAYWTDEMKYNAYGGRAKQNITDYMSVEGMYTQEEKADDPYRLYGGKATLRLNDSTFLSGRFSRSEETLLASGISYDGGFSYLINSANWSDGKHGNEIDIYGQTEIFSRINLSAGYTDTDSHFNTTDSLDRSGRKVMYANLISSITEAIKAGVKYNRQRANDDAINTIIKGNTNFDITSGFVSYAKDKLDAIAEIQHQTAKELLSAFDYMGSIPLRDNDFAAGKIGYKLTDKLYSYIRGQGTLTGKANNQGTFGIDYEVFKNCKIKLAETIGNLGNSTLLGLNSIREDGVCSYTNMEMGTYIDAGKFTKTTTGQSAPVSANSKIYYETDYSSFREKLIQGKVIGYEHELVPGFFVNTNYERANYYKIDDLVNRDSGGIMVTYLAPDLFRLSGKVEVRDDKMNLIRNRQWLASNYLHWYITKDISAFGKIAWSETKEIKENNLNARFYDMGAGVAYRPINFDRLNILTKYNYITDLPPDSQISNTALLTDSKKHVVAIEGSFDLCRYVELVGKCAYRAQEDEIGSEGSIDSDTALYLGRVNFHITKKWDVCGEYRALNNNRIFAQKSGCLVEVQRTILDKFAIGAGYNFTDFDDDLTNEDSYDSSGWFVRVNGKY